MKAPKTNLRWPRNAQITEWVIRVVVAAGVFWLARQSGLWGLALALVGAVEWFELWHTHTKINLAAIVSRSLALYVGVAAVFLIALSPREGTQIALAAIYGLWRIWWKPVRDEEGFGMLNLLGVMIVGYWAVFLMSAVWHVWEWVILILCWVASYVPVRVVLSRRNERTAAVLAAAWAIVAVEIAWVLVRWLFVYTVSGGYLLVPQATLVLGGLAYCFGSIYLSQREGTLSRSRLTEYILIGLILIAIVVTGTPWRAGL